jgi:uncharacterized protein
MLPGPLPERVDVAKLFARNGRIAAHLPISQLARLAVYLADSAGEAQVSLQFALDAEGRRLLTGTVVAELHLACQRCLRSLVWPVSSELNLLVFSTRDELDKLLRLQGLDSMEHDVLVLDEIDAPEPALMTSAEQELNVQTLIEDELILCLPMVPMHEDADCSLAWNSLRSQVEAADKQIQPQPSPFAMLAQLKGTKTK